MRTGLLQDQSKEVQEQRSLCLDMFAMAEECRAREQLNSDPKYSHLLKMQALDPGSLDKLQQLQLQYQVLDQGIKDVDLILDTQWEDYQQRKKNKTNRYRKDPKFSDRYAWADSADPDQTFCLHHLDSLLCGRTT